MTDVVSHSDFQAAATRALDHFSVQAETLRLVAISENVTFCVTDIGGDKYALRLHRPGYNSLRELESERIWTSALGLKGLRVQTPERTTVGDFFCEVPVGDNGERRYAGLTRWLNGQVLGDYLRNESEQTSRLQIFKDIGALAAKMHTQAIEWEMPSGFSRAYLDRDGLLGEDPRWGRFWEHSALDKDTQQLLLRLRKRLQRTLEVYGVTSQNFSLTHADLHPDNLLFGEDVLGIIDFDDAAFGWHMYDLAAALFEYQGDADFAQISDALIAGYRTQRALGTGDQSMVQVFLLIRGLALIGWFHQRPEHTDSNYFDDVLALVIGNGNRYLSNTA
ncbi:phosphotransferase enzyme family protein [Congregibacter sp.]|jgi:Ser/Thr protein kinase RdoA (MazF antagonist)|uniref:phosphotransferase enzyme family protein n=1 Tax=Congregibacter sp. TaxID=2744308 RepID=UPI0039E29707